MLVNRGRRWNPAGKGSSARRRWAAPPTTIKSSALNARDRPRGWRRRAIRAPQIRRFRHH
jgi:hypothetical protein